MSPGESKQLDPAILTAWHHDYSSRLYAFVLGILRDQTLAEEVVQATFTKAFTLGGDVQAGSVKAWLFQVAYREALGTLRKSITKQKTLHQFQKQSQTELSNTVLPIQQLLKDEETESIQDALQQLPEVLKNVVEKRIFEEKTFQQTADELQIPLGTALTRMRTALQQLQAALKSIK